MGNKKTNSNTNESSAIDLAINTATRMIDRLQSMIDRLPPADLPEDKQQEWFVGKGQVTK